MADPPWKYRDTARAGKRGAAFKYPTMSFKELAAMRPQIDHLAGPNCALALWVTGPLLPDCLALLKAWGFKYKTILYCWAKQSKGLRQTVPMFNRWHFGMGHWTRSNVELCLLGVRGRPKRQAKNIRQLIASPVREHSRKPPEARAGLESLFGDVLRLEMFARESSQGWTSWGLEATKFDPADVSWKSGPITVRDVILSGGRKAPAGRARAKVASDA